VQSNVVATPEEFLQRLRELLDGASVLLGIIEGPAEIAAGKNRSIKLDHA